MANTVSEADLASAFLKELGAPDTPLMRKAVVAWMRGESGRTILGGNPWNLRPPAAAESGIPTCGSRTSINGNGQFAVFCNPTDGARAAARLLIHGGNDWRGYGRVVTAARSGKPLDFLNALAKSAWDGGRYGTKNGGPNKLISVFNVMSALGNDTLGTVTVNPPASGQSGVPSGTTDAGQLCAWPSGGGDGYLASPGVCFNVGHVLTTTDANTIVDYLKTHGFFKGDDPMGTGQQVTTALINKLVGSKWSPDLFAFISKEYGVASNAAVIENPVAGALGGIGSILGKAMGFAGGMVLIILGVFLYSKSVRTRVIQEGVPA